MSPRSRAGKVGLRRVDAALDAMLQYGFPRRFIRSTISELLKVYGAEGWVFIEDGSYRLLVETLLQKQEESKGKDCPESLRDEELSGVEGDNTPVAGCSEPPEPEATDMGNVIVTSPSIDIGKEQLQPVQMEKVSLIKMTGEPRSDPIDKFSATNISNSATQTSLPTNNLLCITKELKKEGCARNDKLIMKIPAENIPLQVRRCKKEQLEGMESSEKPLLTSAKYLIKLKAKLDNQSPSAGLYPKPVIPMISEKNYMRVSRSTTDNANFSEANDRKVKKEVVLGCGSVEGENVLRETSKTFSCKNSVTSMAAHTINTIPSHVNIANPVLPANNIKSKKEQIDQHSMHFASGVDRKMGKEGELVNNIKVKKEIELEGCYSQRETAHTGTGLPVSANKVKIEQMECGSMNVGESVERRQMGREGGFFREGDLSHQGSDAPKRGEKICLSVEPTIDGQTRRVCDRTNFKEKQEQRRWDMVEFKTEDRMEQRRSRWHNMAARMGYSQRKWDGIPANMERGRDFGMVADDVERRQWEVNRAGAIPEAGREGHGVMTVGIEHGYRGWDGMGNSVELGRRERDRIEDNSRYIQRGDGGQTRWDKGAYRERDWRSRRNEHDFWHRDNNTFRKENNSFRWRSSEQGRDEMPPRSTTPSQKQVNTAFVKNVEAITGSMVTNQAAGHIAKREEENWDEKLSGTAARHLTANVPVNEDENSGWGSWGDEYLLKNLKVGKKKEEIGPSGAMAVADYGISHTCADDPVPKLIEDKDDGRNRQPLLQPDKKHEQKPGREADHPPPQTKRVLEKPEQPPLPPDNSRHRDNGDDDDDDMVCGVKENGREELKEVENVKDKVERRVRAEGAAVGQCRGWIGRPPYGEEKKKMGGSQRPCHGWIGRSDNNKELVQSVPAVLEEQLRDLVKGRVGGKLRKRRALWDE